MLAVVPEAGAASMAPCEQVVVTKSGQSMAFVLQPKRGMHFGFDLVGNYVRVTVLGWR